MNGPASEPRHGVLSGIFERRWQRVEDAVPLDGTWCWVWYARAAATDMLCIAKRDRHAAGGWTNEDTWDDFEHEVTHWQAIAEPLPPREDARGLTRWHGMIGKNMLH